MLDAHLADGSIVSFEADPVTTAQEVVEMVLNRKAVTDKTGYAVAVVCDGREASISDHESLFELLSVIDRHVANVRGNDVSGEQLPGVEPTDEEIAAYEASLLAPRRRERPPASALPPAPTDGSSSPRAGRPSDPLPPPPPDTVFPVGSTLPRPSARAHRVLGFPVLSATASWSKR